MEGLTLGAGTGSYFAGQNGAVHKRVTFVCVSIGFTGGICFHYSIRTNHCIACKALYMVESGCKTTLHLHSARNNKGVVKCIIVITRR